MKWGSKSMHKTVVVIPNLNGGDALICAVKSLYKQTLECHIIVVDNASTDSSVSRLEEEFPEIELILHNTNKGYAGGVNPGFKRAMELNAKYVAPFNDDAIADHHWLQNLVTYLDEHSEVAAAACKVLNNDGTRLDSTGDFYTVWGLPFPRGRGEKNLAKYDEQSDIFAASGAASLYRVKALEEVGILDEAFFAYYEDVDLSFRLQLFGWKVGFVPEAIVYHHIGMTSQRIKGFTTYQTMKNLPILLYKNVPSKYLWRMGWRFMLAHTLFFIRAISRKQGWIAFKGDFVATILLFKKHGERKYIQKKRKVSDEAIWQMLVHDLPPNAQALRHLRFRWWKLTGKRDA